MGKARFGRVGWRAIPGAELPFFSVIAVVLGLLLLEGLAAGLDEVWPYSKEVLPYLEFQPATVDRSSCGPAASQVACSLLEQDPMRSNPRLLSTCEGQGDEAAYRGYDPVAKQDGEFRVLVLGASSVFHYNRRPEPLVEATRLAVSLGIGQGQLQVVSGTPPPPQGDSWWKIGAEVVVVNDSAGPQWTITRGDDNGGPSAAHGEGAVLTPYRPADVVDSPPAGLSSAQSERNCEQGVIGRLAARLDELLPQGHSARVINGSYPGLSSSDLVGLAQHLPSELDPDLVVIYAGHNEFMDFTYPFLEGNGEAVPLRSVARRSHLYRLLLFGLRAVADLQERTLPPEGYRPWTVFENRVHLCMTHAFDDLELFDPKDWKQVRHDVAERLANNLRFLAYTLGEGGASVLIAEVASNPRLPPCFGARQPWTVDLEPTVTRMDQWQRLHQGERALNEAEFSLALELFSEAAGSDPQAPLGHSGRARALDGLGRHQEAVVSYWLARERSIGDFSSPALINETIAQVAADLELPLVDSPALFVAEDQRFGAPPYHARLIYDEVHPNAAGSDLLAAALAAQAQSAGLLVVPGGPDQ